MEESLSVAAFQHPEVIVSVLAIAVTVILYLWSRRWKGICYEVLSVAPLLTMEDEVAGKLQILFDSRPVEKGKLMFVWVSNSGNLPITADEYERPLSLNFPPATEVLTAEAVDTDPSSLKVIPKIEGKKVVLPCLLLNGGDSIILRIMVSKHEGGMTVDGRISGVKDIQEVHEAIVKPRIAALIGMGLVILSFGTISTADAIPSFLGIGTREISLVIGMLGYSLMLAAALNREFRRKFVISRWAEDMYRDEYIRNMSH